MIAQEQKPIEEILGYLEGKRKIILMGCGGCATFYHTGDKKAVNEMAAKLEKEGKTVAKICEEARGGEIEEENHARSI